MRRLMSTAKTTMHPAALFSDIICLTPLQRLDNRIPHRTFVTIAKRPLIKRRRRDEERLPDGASRYFCKKAESPDQLEWIFEFAFFATFHRNSSHLPMK